MVGLSGLETPVREFEGLGRGRIYAEQGRSSWIMKFRVGGWLEMHSFRIDFSRLLP